MPIATVISGLPNSIPTGSPPAVSAASTHGSPHSASSPHRMDFAAVLAGHTGNGSNAACVKALGGTLQDENYEAASGHGSGDPAPPPFAAIAPAGKVVEQSEIQARPENLSARIAAGAITPSAESDPAVSSCITERNRDSQRASFGTEHTEHTEQRTASQPAARAAKSTNSPAVGAADFSVPVDVSSSMVAAHSFASTGMDSSRPNSNDLDKGSAALYVNERVGSGSGEVVAQASGAPARFASPVTLAQVSSQRSGQQQPDLSLRPAANPSPNSDGGPKGALISSAVRGDIFAPLLTGSDEERLSPSTELVDNDAASTAASTAKNSLKAATAGLELDSASAHPAAGWSWSAVFPSGTGHGGAGSGETRPADHILASQLPAEPGDTAQPQGVSVRADSSRQTALPEHVVSDGRAPDVIPNHIEKNTALHAFNFHQPASAFSVADAGSNGVQEATGIASGDIAHRAIPAAEADPYRQLDQGTSAAVLHTAPNRVAVGVHDPALGWLEINTRFASGQLSAALLTGSSQTHASLSAQLPALTQYLAEHQVKVGHLEVGQRTPGGGNSGEARQERGGSQPDNPPAQAQEMVLPGFSAPPVRPPEAGAWTDAAGISGWPGESGKVSMSYISVRV